ncbi:uncharacterized protein LOC142086494 [Calonectris borealis]|uniref:uncharacterized protein LOC142086494 n=1 Tax=Calonectris borealis TaxID=1323832 RepID=UPI003F4BDB4E
MGSSPCLCPTVMERYPPWAPCLCPTVMERYPPWAPCLCPTVMERYPPWAPCLCPTVMERVFYGVSAVVRVADEALQESAPANPEAPGFLLAETRGRHTFPQKFSCGSAFLKSARTAPPWRASSSCRSGAPAFTFTGELGHIPAALSKLLQSCSLPAVAERHEPLLLFEDLVTLRRWLEDVHEWKRRQGAGALSRAGGPAHEVLDEGTAAVVQAEPPVWHPAGTRASPQPRDLQALGSRGEELPQHPPLGKGKTAASLGSPRAERFARAEGNPGAQARTGSSATAAALTLKIQGLLIQSRCSGFLQQQSHIRNPRREGEHQRVHNDPSQRTMVGIISRDSR